MFNENGCWTWSRTSWDATIAIMDNTCTNTRRISVFGAISTDDMQYYFIWRYEFYFIFPFFEKLFVWKFIVFQSGKNGMRVWQKSVESINKNTKKPFRLKSHLKREFRNDHVHLSNEKKNTNSLGKIGLNCSFALLTKQFKCAKSLLSFA